MSMEKDQTTAPRGSNGEYFELAHGTLILRRNTPLERLYLELTNRCNITCRMCFRNNFAEPFGTMSDTVLDAVLDQIDSLPGLRSVLVGGIGEPLMHRRFREVVTAFRDRGISVEVQTNGMLLTDQLIAFLLDAEVDRIITSYECSSVGHVQTGTLKKKIGRIAELRRQRRSGGSRMNHPRISLEWILTRDSLDHLVPEALEMIDLGVNEFILSNLLPMDESMAGESLIMNTRAGRSDRVALREGGDVLEQFLNITRYRATVQRPEFFPRTERRCDFVDRNSLVIRHDGAVAPCYRLLHTGREYYQGRWREVQAHSFGSVPEQSLRTIWDTRDYM